MPTTFEVHGTPTCGKGEPNQVIHVGHASPACVFADVEVFGGEGVMEAYFHELAAVDRSRRCSRARSYTAGFSAETSDFVRFNHGRVRQPGTVEPGRDRHRPASVADATRRRR